MRFLIWLIIGLVAGGLAKLLVPGNRPMGCGLTLVLGLVGSLVGGLLSSMLWGDPSDGRGFIGSTVGAIIVLLVYGYTQRQQP